MGIGDPKTLEEARKNRYGQWAGDEKGRPYREGECAYTVWGQFSWGGRQCSKKGRYGPDNLYCKVHARKLGMLEPEV